MDRLMANKARVRILATAAGCALAAGVLLMPVSYERVTGHRVTLRMPSPGADAAALRTLVGQVRTALHAKSVQVRVEPGADGKDALVLVASVPQRVQKEVDARTAALVKDLGQRALPAVAQVSAQTERTSGRVYAMALDKIIRVDVDPTGKTDSQVEGEVRTQLESSGIPDPSVRFERHGDASTMQIAADVDGRQLRIHRETLGGADKPVHVEVGGIDDTRDPGMTDAELREKIERQLRARGLDPTVTVTGDRIEIRAHKHGARP